MLHLLNVQMAQSNLVDILQFIDQHNDSCDHQGILTFETSAQKHVRSVVECFVKLLFAVTEEELREW